MRPRTILAVTWVGAFLVSTAILFVPKAAMMPNTRAEMVGFSLLISIIAGIAIRRLPSAFMVALEHSMSATLLGGGASFGLYAALTGKPELYQNCIKWMAFGSVATFFFVRAVLRSERRLEEQKEEEAVDSEWRAQVEAAQGNPEELARLRRELTDRIEAGLTDLKAARIVKPWVLWSCLGLGLTALFASIALWILNPTDREMRSSALVLGGTGLMLAGGAYSLHTTLGLKKSVETAGETMVKIARTQDPAD